jgi:YVTN family beta-propeller protein
MSGRQLAPGHTFAGYRIEGEIGRGGMGIVYRAVDLSLERPVALKLIAPELASDEEFRRRFLRESRLAASLDHPHVLPVFSAGEEDGQLYLAMRYVEGEDLKTLLASEGKLDPRRALRICGQISEALDAAHRRGLVHRDVKPANVLLDRGGEAYLGDFGLTKPAGGASTRTGQLVGTLDYLAPEQIRGGELDGRTDQYALACVLYECLAGKPPFCRVTEAEVLWAHMQEAPSPVPGYPTLDAVLERGLAKEKEARFASCSELVEAAYNALGLETARVRRERRFTRRIRILLAAGVAILAASLAGLVVELTTGSSALESPGNAVAAISAKSGRVVSYTGTGSTPSNVAVGEGSVWVLNADDRTISRIDPTTRRIVKTFGTGGLPTDIAVGEGAIWVGSAGPIDPRLQATTRIARIDPHSYVVTASVALPKPPRGAPRGGVGPGGFSQLALAGGSVWAINPDGSVSRIDAATGRLVSRIPIAFAGLIAAGREGVWVAHGGPRGPEVTRIDPQTGRIGQSIAVPVGGPGGIAVGGGAIWAADPLNGTVWHIEPGVPPSLKTVSVGFGVISVAFSNGAVWAANFANGTVSRIDAATDSVTSVVPLAGTPQGIAVDNDLVWTSAAGGSEKGPLPGSACGPVESGARKPDLLIASDLALQEPGQYNATMADVIRFVLRRHAYRAGRYTVGYQSCDDSTAQTGGWTLSKCGSNAKEYSQAAQLVALIGTYNSGCAFVELPIVNRAPGGSIPMISPSNTDTGLTRKGPGIVRGIARDLPEANYPTGVRNYFRLMPPDDLQGAADAVLARQLGLRSVYVLADEVGFTRAARRLGLRVAGSVSGPQPGPLDSASGPQPGRVDLHALAGRIARSGAGGVFLGVRVLPYFGTGKLIEALRARLGRRFPIIAVDQDAPVPDMLELIGPPILGTYMSFEGLVELGSQGQKFMRAFAAAQGRGAVQSSTSGKYVADTAQAAELVLQAIARSDGTRASVLRELHAARVTTGILGSFHFDRNGDATPARVTVFRITGATPRRSHLIRDFQGAVVDRVISIPTNLLG